MKTFLTLEYAHEDDLPEGVDGDIRTPDALVERFVAEYTDPGDAVVDPFAGFGTTLAVADRLGREPYGIEYDPDRVAYVRERVEPPERVREDDVLTADLSWLPGCELAVTSPPFMERTDTRNPFENYAGESSYDAYLEDVETALGRLTDVLTPGGTLVVDVSNMKHEGRVTTLAWDVAERLSGPFSFDGEVVVGWEAADDGGSDHGPGVSGYGYDHSYCLVFRNE